MSTTRHGAARARGAGEERVLDPPPSTPRHPRDPERAISRGIETPRGRHIPMRLNPLAAGVPAPAGVSSSPSAPTPAPGSRVIKREGGPIMTASKGFVVPAGGGKHVGDNEPDRFSHLKLLTDQTNGSIMMFEQAVPAETKSWFHLHHKSDEVAWVLAGEITFKIGDDVTVGGPGTCAFMP